jgi:hypothetical protein
MKLVVTPSQQAAARLKLKLAKDLSASERAFLTAVAQAPWVKRKDAEPSTQPPASTPPSEDAPPLARRSAPS